MSRYIYEDRKVNSGKKIKWCHACNNTIKIGEPSITVTVVIEGEFFADSVCNQICYDKYKEDFDKSEEDDDGEEI